MTATARRLIRPARDALAAAALTAAGTAELDAQRRLADRVAAVRDGAVEMRFAARRGVCGDGTGRIAVGRSVFGESWMYDASERDWRRLCVRGPVRVMLQMSDGDVVRLRTVVGDDEPPTRATVDLGVVPAREAAAYLLDLAARAGGRVGERAILPAVLADSATIWPALLALARQSERRASATRRTATFWLGRFVAAAAAGDVDALADEEPDDEESDVRSHAVFALSQLGAREGVPALIEVARTNKDPRVRRKAIFWLGQSGDPRALDLFEEMLRHRKDNE